ncbi:MAG: CDP-diacylglycerol--glycerol-3-phosphate 3-phosphatidyltransferase, partial [Acidobacteriota bacterium]|nr:CDP-diacylglycerol--glycerol-3-phosphate 3-phosphatidyltransferase [Acidobacteriota bacterium]
GYTIRASELGKTKTITQVIAISCLLLSIRHPALARPAIWATWGVVVFAMLSALDYFRKFWRKVDIEVKRRRRRELLLSERQRRLEKLRQSTGSVGGEIRRTT